jgi:dUTP pyrophosphatase
MDAYAHLSALREDQGVVVYSRTNEQRVVKVEGLGFWLNPGDRAAVPLGFRAQLPTGWECQVRSRSGLALKQGLVVVNSPGTIDEDYPGEWAVVLTNVSSRAALLNHHDRVAQLVIQPRHEAYWQVGTVGQSTERTGGFGSTGVSV